MSTSLQNMVRYHYKKVFNEAKIIVHDIEDLLNSNSNTPLGLIVRRLEVQKNRLLTEIRILNEIIKQEEIEYDERIKARSNNETVGRSCSEIVDTSSGLRGEEKNIK